MADTKMVHISRLIAIPAAITLAVTILRVVGELQHWSPLFFSREAGGHAALMGISWLPIIFGPYFASKLAEAGDRPASLGKAIGFAFLGLGVFVVAGVLFQFTLRNPGPLTLVAFLLWLASGFVPLAGWRTLGRTLLAYALAARIPVLIVMYLAMSANGGAGWGTHYDAVPPMAANLPLGRKFLFMAVMPQMTLWIAWTVILGVIFGGIFVAVTHRGKQAEPTAA